MILFLSVAVAGLLLFRRDVAIGMPSAAAKAVAAL
jgi:hypothetical protein